MNLSNYRYNSLGGIDADYQIDNEVYPYTLSQDQIDALPEGVLIASYKPYVEVPDKVTRRQAKQQLLIAGLLSQVETIISNIEDPLQKGLTDLYWKEAGDFERNSPYVLAIGNALQLSASELDELFINAAKL